MPIAPHSSSFGVGIRLKQGDLQLPNHQDLSLVQLLGCPPVMGVSILVLTVKAVIRRVLV